VFFMIPNRVPYRVWASIAFHMPPKRSPLQKILLPSRPGLAGGSVDFNRRHASRLSLGRATLSRHFRTGETISLTRIAQGKRVDWQKLRTGPRRWFQRRAGGVTMVAHG
jgi:hypothetical protein